MGGCGVSRIHRRRSGGPAPVDGLGLAIVSNQCLVGEGIITQPQLSLFTDWMVRHLSHRGVELSDIAYCLHSRSEPCGCRKPATGLVDAVLSRHPELTLTGGIVIDQPTDMAFASALGLRGYLVVESGFCLL